MSTAVSLVSALTAAGARSDMMARYQPWGQAACHLFLDGPAGRFQTAELGPQSDAHRGGLGCGASGQQYQGRLGVEAGDHRQALAAWQLGNHLQRCQQRGELGARAGAQAARRDPNLSPFPAGGQDESASAAVRHARLSRPIGPDTHSFFRELPDALLGRGSADLLRGCAAGPRAEVRAVS